MALPFNGRFNSSCASLVILTTGEITLPTLTLAGDFAIFMELSTIAYTPAIAALGGKIFRISRMSAKILLKVGLITFKVSLSNKISTGVEAVAIFAISNFINSARASLTNPAATPSTTSLVNIYT